MRKLRERMNKPPKNGAGTLARIIYFIAGGKSDSAEKIKEIERKAAKKS